MPEIHRIGNDLDRTVSAELGLIDANFSSLSNAVEAINSTAEESPVLTISDQLPDGVRKGIHVQTGLGSSGQDITFWLTLYGDCYDTYS